MVHGLATRDHKSITGTLEVNKSTKLQGQTTIFGRIVTPRNKSGHISSEATAPSTGEPNHPHHRVLVRGPKDLCEFAPTPLSISPQPANPAFSPGRRTTLDSPSNVTSHFRPAFLPALRFYFWILPGTWNPPNICGACSPISVHSFALPRTAVVNLETLTQSGDLTVTAGLHSSRLVLTRFPQLQHLSVAPIHAHNTLPLLRIAAHEQR